DRGQHAERGQPPGVARPRQDHRDQQDVGRDRKERAFDKGYGQQRGPGIRAGGEAEDTLVQGLQHQAWRNRLPWPIRLCCGRCTDLVASAIAWPITEAWRSWRASMAIAASISASATTAQKPIPMLNTSNISVRPTAPCCRISSKIGGEGGRLSSTKPISASTRGR